RLFLSSRYGDPRDLHSFPNTTLFRSGAEEGVGHLGAVTAGVAAVAEGAVERFRRGAAFHLRQLGAVFLRGRLVGEGFSVAFQQSDRKSTRLNSSHVKISYAVFCLKKK